MHRLIIVLAIALLPTTSLAYIDPGTGGMLLQLLLGGIAGALVVGKLYWHRLVLGCRRILGLPTPSIEHPTENKPE